MTATTCAETDEHIICCLHYKVIEASADLAALNEIFSQFKFPSIIGGNKAKADADRFSYWAAEPKEIFEFRDGSERPFEKLQKNLDKYKLKTEQDNHLPKGIFCGGWIGYFSYELGRYIERLPRTTTDDLEMPLMRLCFYDKVLCYDHIDKKFWLIALELPGDIEKPKGKLDALEKILVQSQNLSVPIPAPAEIENIDVTKLNCNIDRDYYIRSIEKIKRYIYDGIVYQVNFSQRFEADYNARPIDLYHWQNQYNASGYAAFIDWDDFSIVSASPEMFITIEDGIISTKPIKGTRPRLADIEENTKINQRNVNDLLHSQKERAELNMIIDLERNDIARICVPGTRKVVQARSIESYPTVFHAVATVAGRLRGGICFSEVLKGVFPGGSITGAPKVSSMEIIDETEPTERAVYTGSIGFIGIDGNAALNIAIRTIIITGKKAYAQTGGGIVADSNVQDEWDETITKARALLASIKTVMRSE